MTGIFRYLKGDKVIWALIIFLSIVSLLAVYSSTGTLAYRAQGGNTAYYILKHFTIMLVGLAMIFITHMVPYKFYSRLSQLFLYASVLLLVLTLVMGTTINQASRWLTLPGLGFTIQTSDFAKLALIMYLARVLSRTQHEIKEYRNSFIHLLLPVLIICALIMPANLSTAFILFATCIILMFIGRVRTRYLFGLIGAGIVFLSLFVAIAMYSQSEGRLGTWRNRIDSFVTKSGDNNYQVEQSKIAIATGGMLGKGPGNSSQRNFLPHPYSDFIYAIIIEEYGLIGGIIVMFFYLWLLYRAGLIVKRSQRTFPAFLAIGLALSIVIQAMINMAVVVNLLPVTGQPLPLVSMGGSSLVFTSIALGIIISVSHGVTKNENNEAETDEDDGKEA
ncbi:MAG: cell division protein FtsW [Marinilabiliales bacterium]|nr:MAG: cell division protein FtsW [Marinilabiliales bacterium]